MDKQDYDPQESIGIDIIKKLEQGLNDFGVARRGIVAILQFSTNEAVSKIALADDETIDAFMAFIEDSFPMLDHFETYHACLKAGQARLLHALNQNGHLETPQ